MKILSIIILSILFIGCGEEMRDNINHKKDSVAIKVGSEGAYKPFAYVDSDGKMQGYDIEVLRLLEQINPNLKFEFVYAPWNALFLGLDSARFDILANQIIKTKERERRYIFNNTPYFVSTSQFIARKDDSTIQSIDDLKGKIVGCVVGSSHTKILEEWNDKNGGILEIRYYKDLKPLLQDLINKRIDIHLNDPASIVDIIKEQNLDLKILDERIAQNKTYFILRNEENSKDIARQIDSALEIAKENGSLSELSIKIFGVDQSK